MKPFSTIAAATLAATAMLVSAPVMAHAKLLRSNPIAQAVIATPKKITLTFSERLVPAFSTFKLSMTAHNMQVPLKTSVSRDGKTVTATPEGKLMAGAYTIAWTAAGSDGHKMQGEVPFKVR
jgi:copper resistance protein C